MGEATHKHFSTEIEGLDEATSPDVIRLRDGDTYEITIKPVRKRLNGAEVRMLGYNGSIPGPTLHVDQGSEVTIEATNLGDVDATLHWHGLRLENRFDGVPEETQAPIPHGGTFTYRLQFPDPASTGTTRTSAKTSPRRWASTRASSSSRPSPTTGRR
jgi:Multicopper oxidase